MSAPRDTNTRADGCDDCGRPHPKCYAHNSQGNPCGAKPVTGGRVCSVHGGRAPQVKAAAARRTAEAAAAREVARLGLKLDVHPAEALIDLVHWTAGEVAYWRSIVIDIETAGGHQALTWGVTSETYQGSGEFPGTNTTSETAPHIAYRMLTDASSRLAAYSTAALKANVDERRVQLAEQQGAAVAGAVRRILERLNLTPDQQALIGVVIPEELRRLVTAKEPA